MDRINMIFLPFLPVPLKAGMKGKKSSSLFEGGSSLYMITSPFPPLAGLNILPSIREGRIEKDPSNPVNPV